MYYEGRQHSLNSRTTTFNLLRNANFRGEFLNLTFKKYIEIQMNAHKYLEDMNHSTPNGLDEARNIQYFDDEIRSQTNLDIILAVACNN